MQSIDALVARAARWGIPLTTGSARALLTLGGARAARKVDDVCTLIRVAGAEQIELDYVQALRRLNACGGSLKLALHRTLAGSLETREGMQEALRHAADHGVELTPEAICRLWSRLGRPGTLRHIEDIGEIRDAAAKVGEPCSQAQAVRRLNAADGDATAVVAALVDAHRRRIARIARRCSAPLIPRGTLEQRAETFAACGCPTCQARLAEQLHSYVGKVLASPSFAGLEEDEARACGYLVLLEAIETWPGIGTGKFTGWYASQLGHRLHDLMRERERAERDLARLDAPAFDGDPASRGISLGERVPDRTISVELIVILREQLRELYEAADAAALERLDEYAELLREDSI